MDHKRTSYERYHLHVVNLHAVYKEAVRKHLPIDPPTEFGQALSELANHIYEANLRQDLVDILNLEVLEERVQILGESHDHTIDSYYAVGMVYFRLDE